MSDFVHAAKSGDLATVRKLEGLGCDVNMTQGEDQYTALYWAACYGHSKVVDFLLNHGANSSQSVKWGSTPLHAAAERGHRDCIFYLAKWCDVNVQNWNHLDTPLHLAAYRGHLQVCQQLLRHGADVTIRNRQNKTPLDEAAFQGQGQVYELLLQWFQDPTVKYNNALRRCSTSGTQRSSFVSEGKFIPSDNLQTDGDSSDHYQYPSYGNMSQEVTTPTQYPNLPTFPYQKETTNFKENYSRELPGNPQYFQRTGELNEVNTKIIGRQGSHCKHKEVVYNNAETNLLANGQQIQYEDEVDGICGPRIKLPSEHSSDNSVFLHTNAQGRPENLLKQNSSYLKQNIRNGISPDAYDVTSKDSLLRSSSRHTDTFCSNKTTSQNNTLPHRDLRRQHSESHSDLLNILQLQIVNVQDEVEFLKQKNTELWIQCEKYRSTEAGKSKLLTIYDQKYQQSLAENEHLKKTLKENEAKTKAAIVKLMQHYKTIHTQSGSPTSEASPVVMAEQTAVHSTVQFTDSSEDLIQLDERPESSKALRESATEQHPHSDVVYDSECLIDLNESNDVPYAGRQEQSLDKSSSSYHLTEKVPQQCSDGSDTEETKKVVQHADSLNESSSASSQSSDSFTSKMIQSYTANCTDHKELFSAILPVFQSMDVSLQSTMSEALHKQLKKRNLVTVPNPLEDQTGREWTYGIDYVLVDDFPINRHEHYGGSSSLVFRIRHRAKVYILKMMMNHLDLSQTQHGAGQSLPQFQLQQSSTEHSILSSIPQHSNVTGVLHHYNGDTQHFKRFFKATASSEVKDTCVDVVNQTTFLVMPLYSKTLDQLFQDTLIDQEEVMRTVPEIFVLQKLYDVLSAVHHLEKNKVVHRDIKADCVYLDHELRAVLGDFGFARRFQGASGESIPFVDRSQILAGNCNAWTPELESMNRGGPESLKGQVSLEDIYSSTDSYAVGKMFFNLICQKSKNKLRCALTDIPDSYSGGMRYIVKTLCHSDTRQRLTTENALVLCGLLLFGPEQDEVKSRTDCIIWHQSRMMKLLVQKSYHTSRQPIFGNYTCTIEESIMINNRLLEKSFFSNFSGEQIWACFLTYQSLRCVNTIT